MAAYVSDVYKADNHHSEQNHGEILIYIQSWPNEHSPFSLFLISLLPPPLSIIRLICWHCYVTSGTGQTFPS